jgi:ankyrin repeat protein
MMRGGAGLLGLALAVVLTAAAPAGQPLVDAAKRGDAAEVRALLRAGADPNAAQGDGLTALHVAAQAGNLEIARLLIDARANVDVGTRIGGYTPLHLAAQAAHAEVVAALLAAGADANVAAMPSGATPLHLAARAIEGEAAVRALLEGGADANAREAHAGQTPLMFAASYGRIGAVRELLQRGADPALATDVVDLFQRMVLDQQAQAKLRETSAALRQNSAEGTDRELTAAEAQDAIRAQREFVDGVDLTSIPYDRAQFVRNGSLYQGGEQIAFKPFRETLVGKSGGMTALLHAAREGQIEVARALLDGGADIDQVSGDGTSPLLEALLNGQYDLALVLVERGANPNLVSHTEGTSPLFALLNTQFSPKSNYPQPRAQDHQQAEYLAVLNALLEAGADPNVRLKTHLWYWEFGLTKMGLDLTGATPFWRAAFAQDVQAMKALAAHGADPGLPTAWPDPGLRERRQQDGRQQEDSGLPVIPEGTPNMYPIHAAAGGGYMGLGAFMVNNVPNSFLAAVKYLVEEQGADVNLRDSWGYTPLHYAAVRGGNDLVEYLVAKGADVTATSRLGQTPVDMARGGRGGFFSRNPYPKTVELLQGLGSPFKCLDTHFRDTGDYCPGAGVPPFEGAVISEELLKP